MTKHGLHSGQPPSRRLGAPPPDDRVALVRERIAEEVLRLTRLAGEEEIALAEGAGVSMAADGGAPRGAGRYLGKIRLLHQIARALEEIGPGEMPAEGAGVGSMLTLEDAASGDELEFTLMVGGQVDVDAGQLSLASPIGQAVLGHRAGHVVDVVVPSGRRSFRIRSVVTLAELLGLHSGGRRPSAAAVGRTRSSGRKPAPGRARGRGRGR